jgi:hypothetical protein
MDRRDHRLLGAADELHHVRHIRQQHWFTEFADVGARNEGAPLAPDGDSLDGRVGVEVRQRFLQSHPKRM